jgi:succinate dehydrogenase / fumarate reductase membrane anchor subunit
MGFVRMKTATGTRSGTGLWLAQRASAVVLAGLVPLLALRIAAAAPFSYSTWTALFAPLWMRVGVLLLTLALALHAWIGVRDICMDYLHHTGVRLAVYLAAILLLAVCVVTMATTLWSTH